MRSRGERSQRAALFPERGMLSYIVFGVFSARGVISN